MLRIKDAAYRDAQADLVDRVIKVALTYVEVFEGNDLIITLHLLSTLRSQLSSKCVAAAAIVAIVDVFAAWADVCAKV